ncbi:MAG: 6-phosphogluconolactonase, partial [Proteobacteria bacterium]|nr:6-phosphogluconolactonase [Pseudomonadota bacterium]
MLTIERFPDLETLSRKAAELIYQRAIECVREKNVFTLVLSGGTTPGLLYKGLASPPYIQQMPWASTHLFWGDERFVPAGHTESNFSLAYNTLISKVPLPQQNIHRIETGMKRPEDAADAYEKNLREFFEDPCITEIRQEKFPRFDLILLGVGTDGHTASLFPCDEVLKETKRWVTAVPAPACPPLVPRITLTLPVINNADCVVFLISGSEKIKVVQ